jgi:hypothetical protein
MPNPNVPIITPPRVPLVDPRTGLISRAWYLFFLSLNNIATGVIDSTDSIGPDSGSLIASVDAALQAVNQELQTLPNDALQPQIAELQKQIEALQVQPIVDAGAISAAIAALSSAPVTYTANFSVAATNVWIINNKSGSSCTATLPTASISAGRVLYFQNYQAQTLVSASSNVVPLAGGSATTAILEAVAGANATLVSDGTSWIMTQYSSNNSLQLE